VRSLVIHPGAMGDLILSLPALSCLQRQWPEGHVVLAANTDFSLAVAQSVAADFLSLSSLPMPGLFTAGEISAEDFAFWRSFDRVLSWTGAADPDFVRRLNKVHPRALVVPWRPSAGEARHVSELFLASLAPWITCNHNCGPADIHLGKDYEKQAERKLTALEMEPHHRFIAVHPGAGNSMKRWPMDRYKKLIYELLRIRSDMILIIEGPAEVGLASEIAQGLDGSRVRKVEGVSAGVLAGIIARSDGYIGNDSGVSHLAAAVGVPSLVLFGPTKPCNWSPLGRQVQVLCSQEFCPACNACPPLQHTCLESLAVETVRNEFLALLLNGSR
jgi:ADP-heptose:LPS heptosyltransferase